MNECLNGNFILFQSIINLDKFLDHCLMCIISIISLPHLIAILLYYCIATMYSNLTCSISYGVSPVLDLRNVNKFNSIQFNILEVLCYIKKHKADLIQNINIHSYNTRINKDFHVQFCRTTLFKKSVVNMGIELHSKLPDKIKNSVGFSVFKKDLKSFLLKHSFYTINEFVSFK